MRVTWLWANDPDDDAEPHLPDRGTAQGRSSGEAAAHSILEDTHRHTHRHPKTHRSEGNTHHV